MPITDMISVKQLRIDLENFRTTPQPDEAAAIRAMIAIKPDWFWALMESILNDGYHPTENIIVLNQGTPTRKRLIVKEGNRRVAVLKMVLGIIEADQFDLPSHIDTAILDLPRAWKSSNSLVPCAIYTREEADAVDRVITLIHGKAEQAGRDKWTAVARARHNRDANGASEPGLDLLEKYLKKGNNLTHDQSERWSGTYPVTVLDEALKRLAPRCGFSSARELADAYPKRPKNRAGIESLLHDIGLNSVKFETLRSPSIDFAARYGFFAASEENNSNEGAADTMNHQPAHAPSTDGAGQTNGHKQEKEKEKPKPNAVASDDPAAVIRALKKFTPKGHNRGKLVTLLKEARTLKPDKYPHAFCFVLRSMFEISAKVYGEEHGIQTVKGENDRKLIDILRDITAHLSSNNKDKQMVKALHGSMTEMGNPDGILSVTSMNQLIHNPRFSTSGQNIAVIFGNAFPLLEAMNK